MRAVGKESCKNFARLIARQPDERILGGPLGELPFNYAEWYNGRQRGGSHEAARESGRGFAVVASRKRRGRPYVRTSSFSPLVMKGWHGTLCGQ